MTKLLDQLNKKQKEAVLQTEGPVLIIAGAGSGKTRALTFRVAFLVKEERVPPKNILAVTFTNKAAGEMMDRVKELLGLPKETPPYSQYLPHIGTFHSICVRILRKEVEKMGYAKNFVIYDDQDQLAAMKRVMKELSISQEDVKPQAILNAISDAKNKLIDAKGYEEMMGSFFEERVAKCFHQYAKNLKEADALDFDDLIMITVQLFQKYPDVLDRYQELFRYIMVDEYQDTNHAQYMFLKLLATKYKNICVVGDDFQSVYMWRGADINNILDFEKDYPEAKVVLLEQNYRSTKNILNAAQNVIEKNVNQKKKKLWTDNDAGNLLTLYEAFDEKDEAQFVVAQINKLQSELKNKLDDFAVLYRTNAQSRALEEIFLKFGVPYKIIGGIKFYQRKEIKDILAYLYFLINPRDKVSFERIINIPARGLGEKTVAKVLKASEKFAGDVLKTIENLDGDVVNTHGCSLQASKIKALHDFAKIISRLQEYAKKNRPSKIIEEVFQRSGYKEMLDKMSEEGAVRAENVLELLTVANKFDDEKNGLQLFLEEVALVSQVDRDLEEKEMVPLMTLHSAKGLEYDVVFLVGMEEGLFPHSRATLNEKEMEEERRLCYVGITRAKQKAHLIYTSARNIYGSTQVSVRSRFIDEVDNELFEEIYTEQEFGDWIEDKEEGSTPLEKGGRSDLSERGDFKNKQKISPNPSFPKRGTSPAASKVNFSDGDRVSHADFGEGIVVAQDDATVSVAFPKHGVKKLAKGIAPLKKI